MDTMTRLFLRLIGVLRAAHRRERERLLLQSLTDAELWEMRLTRQDLRY
jgi:hypothetical protein